jgi:hypothetical protein
MRRWETVGTQAYCRNNGGAQGGQPMPHVQEVSIRDLNARRKAILERIGMSCDELAAKAAARSLVGDEWAAWEEIREIDFLRNR